MNKIIISIFFVMLLTGSFMGVNADWDPEDGHKMHFPQLPDSSGWDIHATNPMVCADDWICSESGNIKGIHFWGSWLDDNEGVITKFKIGIFNDKPAGQGRPYSRPGVILWYKEITNFEIRGPYQGNQGWYWPELGQWIYPDHYKYYQYNIFLEEEDFFWQEEEEIYWLAISAFVNGEEKWGWKSSYLHWNDDACWSHDDEWDWIDIWEPPYDTVIDSYNAIFDQDNNLLQGGGTGFEGNWFYYPETYWWNMWFYNAPFDNERMKKVDIFANLQPEPGVQSFLTLAINWATPYWSELGNQYPPIPPIENEFLYIERDILFEGSIEDPTELDFTYYIRDYNPEWVSIDIMGESFIIDGTIEHTCFQSLDLAFVITGRDESIPSIYIEKKVSDDNGITWNEDVNVELEDIVRFKITVENNGDVDLNYIKITDLLPLGLEYANNADPIEPIISGNELTWIYTNLDVGKKKEIEFDGKAIESGENINEVSVITQEEISDGDTATVNVGEIPNPDLDCEGEIQWSGISTGSTVSDTIYVKNIGETGSKLKWRVCGYPTNWGSNWNFNPDQGDNLKPSDGLKPVTVTVVAPGQKNQQYTGQIKFCNEDDSNDICFIQVSLATPKNKSLDIILFTFLQNFTDKFPNLEYILKIIYYELI